MFDVLCLLAAFDTKHASGRDDLQHMPSASCGFRFVGLLGWLPRRWVAGWLDSVLRVLRFCPLLLYVALPHVDKGFLYCCDFVAADAHGFGHNCCNLKACGKRVGKLRDYSSRGLSLRVVEGALPTDVFADPQNLYIL